MASRAVFDAKRELERLMHGSKKFRNWDNEFQYHMLLMIERGEEHDLIRAANMGELIDNEGLRNAAKAVLTLQLEYEDARANKFEGMTREQVNKLRDAIHEASDTYEFLRRLIDADNNQLVIIAG